MEPHRQNPPGAPDGAPAPWADGATAGGAGPFRPFADQQASGPMSPPYQPSARPGDVPSSSSDERTLAALVHLSGFVAGFLGPLVLWLIKRDESAFIDHHGKQALNFQLSMFIYFFVAFIAIFFLIGLVLIPLLIVLQFVLPVVGAIRAGQGRTFSYGFAIPFVS